MTYDNSFTDLKNTYLMKKGSKRFYRFFWLMCFFILFIAGCTKNSDNTQSIDTSLVDVYIGGHDDGLVCYWKNGVEVIVERTTIGNGNINGMAMLGTDLYAVGKVGYKARMWKNGIGTDLTDGDNVADARGILISNGNIYIPGYEYGVNLGNKVLYWKNGIKTVLNASGQSPVGNAIDVVGNDVYLVGNIDYNPKSWKNGNLTNLSDGIVGGDANAILHYGNDEYIVGVLGSKAVYWKNGVVHKLSDSTSVANAIAILNNDIYIVGEENNTNAVYWKNGVKTVLAYGFSNNSTLYATANSIAINGNNIFIAGTVTSGFNTSPVYWKNGVKVTMQSGAGTCTASTIMVVSR